MAAASDLPVPDFASWPIFPFEGDIRVRAYEPLKSEDWPRTGEPGGGPCAACAAGDDEFIWVDERWRVRAHHATPSVPMQLFLETREHVDMDELDPELAAELGRMLVRLDRAVQAIDGVGRVHISRWGDGASHFHMWIYARPVGAHQMLGFCLPMWAMILPPIDEDVWRANQRVVASELAREGGIAAPEPG